MAIERESTRLFREARRARRVLGDRAGEAAAAQLGEYATKVAATEPAGIGSRDERMARQTLRRQSAALASGFRPNGAAATGDALAARQDLFKRMQAAGPQGAEQFRREASALGVSDVGFDRALRSVGGAGGAAATPTTAATPAPTTAPATTATNQDNIPLFLRRTQQTAKPTAGPVSKIDGLPAEQVLSGASVGLSKADILRKAREESATNPSVTRQDVIDRMNAERRSKGFADVEITGKELADIDSQDATNAAAAGSLQVQKYFNTMSDIEKTLKPKTTAPVVAPKPATPAAATPAEPTDAELMAKIPSASSILLRRAGEQYNETFPGMSKGVGEGLIGGTALKVGEAVNRLGLVGQMKDIGKSVGVVGGAAISAVQKGAEQIRREELKRMRDELRAKKAAQQ